MKYIVRAEENSHAYDDPPSRWTIGEFDNREVAIEAAKRVIDQDLQGSYQPGMTAAQLFSQHCAFGEDAYIVTEDPTCKFSSREYARARCQEIAARGAASQQEAP